MVKKKNSKKKTISKKKTSNIKVKPSPKKATSKLTKKKVKPKTSFSKPKEKQHHLKISDDPFVKGFLNKTGFYRYTHMPFYIVVFTLFIMFFFEMFLYTKYTSTELICLKDSLLFMPLMVIITLVCLFAFLYLGYKGAQKNFLFNKMFSAVVNIVLLIAVIEIILTFIGFMTFLAPFVIASFESVATQKLYLFYLISWIFVKSTFYLFMTALSYLVFYKLRFVKY